MSITNFVACSVNQLPCPLENQVLVSFADLVASAVSEIQPLDFAAAYAFGAGSVITWWGIGFAVSVASKAISKA